MYSSIAARLLEWAARLVINIVAAAETIAVVLRSCWPTVLEIRSVVCSIVQLCFKVIK